MKDKIIRARVICEEVFMLNEENAEMLGELLNDEEIVDKYAEILESLKENTEKIHYLL